MNGGNNKIVKNRIGALDPLRYVQILVGFLFVWAAISKLANLTEFYGSILAYEMPIPKALSGGMAIVLPWVEFFLGLMLLINLWPWSAHCGAILLLGLFVSATGQAWARGLRISCGCFNLEVLGLPKGASEMFRHLETAPGSFAKNVLLSSLLLYFWYRRNPYK